MYKGTLRDASGQFNTICAKEFLVSLRGSHKKKLKKEIENIVALNHPNVLLHYGIDFNRSILVTEYVEKIIEFDGSKEHIHSTRQLLDVMEEEVPWRIRVNIAMQAAEGLTFLHSQGIIHADIKAGNVFLGGGNDSDKWLVKLGDFGESLFEFIQFTSTQVSSLDSTRKATTAFLAPERKDAMQKPTIASDTYAFAMFLVELTLPKRIHPFDGDLPPNSAIVDAAARGLRPTLPESVNEISYEVYKSWTSVISKAWSQDPEARPNCQVLLNYIKELCIVLDRSHSEGIAEQQPANAIPKVEYPDEIVHLELHQGTAVEVLSEIAADSIHKTGHISPHLQQEIDQTLEARDGTNACVFLSLLILDNLKRILSSGDEIDISRVKIFSEESIKRAPKLINQFRDRVKLMAVDEALALLQGHNMLTFQYEIEERLLGLTKDYSYLKSLAALETALHQLVESGPGFAIYTQTPISLSIVAMENQLIIVDTHQVHKSLGGNGNGAVVVFSRQGNQLEIDSIYKRASIWILNRISKSVLKLGPQSLVVLKGTSPLRTDSSQLTKDEGTSVIDFEDNLECIEWEDDEKILENLNLLAENPVAEVETYSEKFVEIPSAAQDVTIQGHATKLGIMKLKDFQLRAVKAVLEGRDSLIVQSTSSGKSACFQLPAVILKEEYFVLVVSPTVSLMESQVHSLTKLGVDAVFLGAASSSDWTFSNLDNSFSDDIAVPKLVYVTPEYLIGTERRPGAYLKLPSERIGLIVIDECHKIFERSGNFR